MLTIVVGVEESEHSLDALTLARRLAGRDGALLLVCAYPVERPMAGDGGAADARGLHAQAEKTLARLGDKAGSRTLAVPDRHPAHALAQVAAEVGAATIVVGSSRAGSLRRVLPGSTGEHLLESASCAVAIAPRGYREHAEQSIDVIVCAFDGTPEARRVLTVAEALARRLDASLRVIRVVESPGSVDATRAVDPQAAAAARRIRERPLDDLRRVVAELDHGVDADAAVLYGEPAEELVRASFSADLVVAGSRGYGPLHALLAGAVSGRLIRGAACPLIVVPRAARTRAGDGGAVALAGYGTPSGSPAEVGVGAHVRPRRQCPRRGPRADRPPPDLRACQGPQRAELCGRARDAVRVCRAQRGRQDDDHAHRLRALGPGQRDGQLARPADRGAGAWLQRLGLGDRANAKVGGAVAGQSAT
jgi:nucleotide-binding universal stress UspA family protein